MRLLLIFAILWNTCYAECTKNVESVKKGNSITAACDGFFVKQELMNELKNNDEVLKLREKEIQNLRDIGFRQEQITDFYKDRTNHLNNELKRVERKSFWNGVGMFALGVIVTGLAAKVAIESTRK